MNFIHHENTFVRRDFIQQYGGFNEDRHSVMEYGLWLCLVMDHIPLIVNDVFTVFIIHKGSTSNGNIFRFSKAVMRAFHTQHEEKVFPLLGYYSNKPYYRNYRKFVKIFKRFITLLDFDYFFL